MKIPSLLAQYFYSNQRLELPGVGIFTLDSSAIQALQTSKQRSATLEGVSFKSDASIQQSPDLIAFIAEKTGKMKPLAAADLDSYLELAMQFLNMGKPFLIEGIGIITKVKPKEFEFTSTSVSTEKLKELNPGEAPAATPAVVKDESASGYDSFLSTARSTIEWKKPVVGLMLLCGLGLTIWGGYIISQKNKKHKLAAAVEQTAGETKLVDTLQKIDSSSLVEVKNPVNDNYKYILEVAKSKRAFKRYKQLKEIRWKVELETQDSIQYKLYMLLPSIADTTRTMDSLTVMTGRKVYIEYPN